MEASVHEARTQLAAIVTSGNACLRWLDLAPPNLERARRSVRRIVGDANRAGEVIRRVRGLAKGETPHQEELDLNQVVLEVLDLARGEIKRQGISQRLALADDLPPVLADRIQLQQVIGNLVLNAAESMAVRVLVLRFKRVEPNDHATGPKLDKFANSAVSGIVALHFGRPRRCEVQAEGSLRSGSGATILPQTVAQAI